MDLVFNLSDLVQALEDTLTHEEIEIFLSTDLLMDIHIFLEGHLF